MAQLPQSFFIVYSSSLLLIYHFDVGDELMDGRDELTLVTRLLTAIR